MSCSNGSLLRNRSLNKKCCVDKFGCCVEGTGPCPDFEIKRYDTKPDFVLSVSDCDGPLDLDSTVVEVSMWAKAKLKKAITSSDTSFALSGDIGFEQSLVGDIILMDRARSPEMMLVVGHDEDNKLVIVQRGYHGTNKSAYARSTNIKMFRVLNGVGEPVTVRDTITKDDNTEETVVTDSQLVYSWGGNDTCLPGCYYFEFKLLKMSAEELSSPSTTASIDQCSLGYGVEWVRRFPVNGSYLVKIIDSPTFEGLVG